MRILLNAVAAKMGGGANYIRTLARELADQHRHEFLFLVPDSQAAAIRDIAPHIRIIPSNIAEGQARLTTVEFKQSLGHARGSLMEVETYILLAQELGYLQNDESEGLLARTAEVGKILNGLLNSLARVTNH